MRLTYRLTIVLLLVLAIHLAARATQLGGWSSQVEPPKPDLRTLPMQLGDWTGKEVKEDAAIAKKVGAEYAFDRVYRGPYGNVVSLHVAVITNYGAEGVHHFPQGCYRGGGHELLHTERRQLKTANGDEIPASFSLWAHEDGPAAVAYWYHFGDDVIFNIDEFRWAKLRRWGSGEWPPIVKVMLETPAVDSDRIPPCLEEFATLVAEQTCVASRSAN